MDKALEQVGLALDAIPAARDVLDGEKSHQELLGEWTRDGLILGRDTVRMVRAALEADGDAIDLKLLRLGNDAAAAAARLSMRAQEGEFRAKRSDVIEQLLARIAVEGAKPAIEHEPK